VQRAPATTPIGAGLRRQLMIDAQQQREDLRVLQEGMAHRNGLFFLIEERLCHRGRLFKVPEGDHLLQPNALLDQISAQRHQDLWPCSPFSNLMLARINPRICARNGPCEFLA